MFVNNVIPQLLFGCEYFSTLITYFVSWFQFFMIKHAFCVQITSALLIKFTWFVAFMIVFDMVCEFTLCLEWLTTLVTIEYCFISVYVCSINVLFQLVLIVILVRAMSTCICTIMSFFIMCCHVFFYLTFSISSETTYTAPESGTFPLHLVPDVLVTLPLLVV